MTDSPDQPPKPHPERTAQLAALVEDIPEDDAESADSGEAGYEGDEGDQSDYAPPDSQVPLVSRPPPLLPKEKKQVRNRAFLIGGVFFVVCVMIGIAIVVSLGHGPAATPPPHPPVATHPVVPPATPVAVAPHPHTHITLDEIVFTSDGGAAHP